MRSKFYTFKEKVIKLRKSGKTYGEIQNTIGYKIAKSTLSDWCHSIYLTSDQKKKIDIAVNINSKKGLALALKINKDRREKYLNSIKKRNEHLASFLKNKDIAKIVLTMLYLGEGSKKHGTLVFGNSDPYIISLFLYLLRFCYNIDENKFRCTIQCRADHHKPKLEDFWSSVTQIPLEKFYKARIDNRSIGKISKNKNYKGVCRIDYFSADVFLELMSIPKILYHGPVAQW